MQKIDHPETWVNWFKMKILLCKVGERNFFYINFFDCLVKFRTLLYNSKTQWSNSQKVNFIGFWSPYMCTFHLAYFMRVRPLQDPTVYHISFRYCSKNRVPWRPFSGTNIWGTNTLSGCLLPPVRPHQKKSPKKLFKVLLQRPLYFG